jgi:hypothetical protein
MAEKLQMLTQSTLRMLATLNPFAPVRREILTASQQGLKTLCKQAFHPDTATDAAREALSCVANAMLLKADMRTAFAALGLWAPAIERLKVCNLMH